MSAVYYFFLVIGGKQTLPDGTVVPGTYYLSSLISGLVSVFICVLFFDFVLLLVLDCTSCWKD